jgi:nitrogen fixation protein FixH
MKEKHQDAGRVWRISLAAMVGLFICATVASLVVAKRRVSRVVDADYYRHGLHYGQRNLSGERGHELGWRLEPVLAAGQIQVRVDNADGQPVTGGRMIIDLEESATGTPAGSLVLDEKLPGVYRTAAARWGRRDIRGTMRFSRGNAEVREKVVVFN